MPSLCLYFHAHQPIRLREFSLLDINRGAGYEDEAANLAEFNALLDSRCLPLNLRLREALLEYKGALRAGISLSGNFLEMLEKHRPGQIASYRALAQTGCVEFLGENYFRSFSLLYSEEEFLTQVKLHRKKVRDLFGCVPVTFRNTEELYGGRLAQAVERLGFRTLLNEPAGKGRGIAKKEISNFEISDKNPIILISVDCSLLDEAGTEDLFRFIEKSLAAGCRFIRPAEACSSQTSVIDSPPASPAQVPGGVNYMQSNALHALYSLAGKIRRRRPGLLATWRRLQLSDHFNNMKTGAQGNEKGPYSSPYAAYITYMNILADLAKSAARGQ